MVTGYNLIQTRGIYNRRRDGEQTKATVFKAAANRAVFTAVMGLFMLWIFIFVLLCFSIILLCKVSK